MERRSAGRLPWLTMLLALLSGPVPRSVWRTRMRTCMACPLYSTVRGKSGKLYLCKSSHPAFSGLGCGCAVNVAALAAAPYPDGCYGRSLPLTLGLGWPAHVWPHWWSRHVAVIDFIRGK